MFCFSMTHTIQHQCYPSATLLYNENLHSIESITHPMLPSAHFTGIPGCGKSALSYALISSPEQRTEAGGVLGDGLEVDHLMGDKVEGMCWMQSLLHITS